VQTTATNASLVVAPGNEQLVNNATNAKTRNTSSTALVLMIAAVLLVAVQAERESLDEHVSQQVQLQKSL
jgi:hypothetical protein